MNHNVGSGLVSPVSDMSHYVNERLVSINAPTPTPTLPAVLSPRTPLRPLPRPTLTPSPAPLLTRILLPNAAAPPSFEFVTQRVTPGTPGLDTAATLADQQQLRIAELEAQVAAWQDRHHSRSPPSHALTSSGSGGSGDDGSHESARRRSGGDRSRDSARRRRADRERATQQQRDDDDREERRAERQAAREEHRAELERCREERREERESLGEERQALAAQQLAALNDLELRSTDASAGRNSCPVPPTDAGGVLASPSRRPQRKSPQLTFATIMRHV